MSPKLPQVSGEKLVGFLEKFGYSIIRQKGSHIRLRKESAIGVHNVTVPNHKSIAKGTLNDILFKVSLWNNTTKDELLRRLNA